MATEPFLEIKVNTDTLHFALELFRLAADLKPRLFPFAERFEVDASEVQPVIRRVFLRHVDITTVRVRRWMRSANSTSPRGRSRHPQPGQVVVPWSLFPSSCTRGGAYPLLVRLLSCSYPLYPLLEQVIVRCRALWDGQLVSIDRQSHALYGFFQHTDARTSPWLSLLEQEFFGATYADKAPSVQRTARERIVLSARTHSTTLQKPASAPAEVVSDGPLLAAEVGSDHSDARPTRPTRPPCEETRATLAKLRELFDDKQAGRHPQLSWNVACQRVSIDLKTAEAYEPELKAAWQQMDKTKR